MRFLKRAILKETLNLNDFQVETVYNLERYFKNHWLNQFLDLKYQELGDLASKIGAHEGNLQAVHRHLQNLRRLPFLVQEATEDSVT
ncbi:MAG: protein of unknown function DUF87, partial [Dehalococcoidia bacterium]|nr:protein of unknown function DUF87 [Dehalococcoidia bacterium]